MFRNLRLLFFIPVFVIILISVNALPVYGQRTVEKYANGNKRYQGKKSDGVKVGKHTFWFENGEKQKEETYNYRGVLIRVKEWNESGEQIRDEQPERGLEILRKKLFKDLEWNTGLNGVAFSKLKGNLDVFEPIEGRKGIMVHYATYLENGKEIDSSFRTKVPLPIDFSTGNSIKGFLLGLKYFEVGDNGYIKVPSYLGYGTNGTNGVPPDATLYFQVLVLSTL